MNETTGIGVYKWISRKNISDNHINLTFKEILDYYLVLDKKVVGHKPFVVLEECYELTYILDAFYWYYVPFLSVCGIVGNSLSYLVFLKTHLKKRSSSYYLAALSAADFGFLVSITMVWMNNKLDIPAFNKDGWCQIMMYVSNVCSFLSVWLIVAFTVERFIAVQYPLHRPRICTISRARRIVTILIGVSLFIYSYTFLTAGIIHTANGDVCDLRETYIEIMKIVNIFDTLITLIIPVGLIIIMNAMIVKNVFRFGKNPWRNGSSTNQSDILNSPIALQSFTSNSNSRMRTMTIRISDIENEDSVLPSHSECRAQSIFQEDPNVTHVPTHNGHQLVTGVTTQCVGMQVSCGDIMSTKTQDSITKMLLLVSTVFISLNFPSYILRLCIFFGFCIWRAETPGNLWCAQQLFMLLYYTNFSINFILYSMCGTTFRSCLLQLLRNFFNKFTLCRIF